MRSGIFLSADRSETRPMPSICTISSRSYSKSMGTIFDSVAPCGAGGADCHRNCHRTGEYRTVQGRKRHEAKPKKTNITGRNATKPDWAKRPNGVFKTGAL